MKYNSGQSWDYFYADQIAGLNPEAGFYNLFACSNARFVERGYCGGCYVFQTTTGLGAVGSTKTGSMLRFEDFYFALSEARPLAEALSIWFYWRMMDGVEPWEQAWFYGMCLVGDGTLKARVPTALAETPGRALPSPCRPTIARGVLRLKAGVGDASAVRRLGSCPRPALLDACGRSVLLLHPGPNDISHLSPGVYFVRGETQAQNTVPVVVVR
jgi:hypothetical protein